LAVTAIVASVAEKAQAFQFGDNDLVLAIYGNNTEALVNLGNADTRLASGASFSTNVATELAAAQVGTAANVRYTIFGWNSSMNVFAATAFDQGSIPTGGVALTNQLNPAVNWSFQVNDSNTPGNTVAKSSAYSFASNLNTAGDGNFEGAWTVAMQGTLGTLLNIMKGDANDNSFSQVGRVLLASDGTLTIGNPGPNGAAPVPLPAGVVLFGSGLIGLIGMARRSFNRTAA
jgi:hypothetical protein